MVPPTSITEGQPPEGAARIGPRGATARLRAGLSRLFPGRRWWSVVGVLAAVAILVLIWLWQAWWPVPQLQAWHHLRAARLEIQRYHTPQALRHLEVCQRVWPEDPDALLVAARASRRALRYSEAEDLLEKYQRARGVDDPGSFEQLLLTAERNVDRVANQCWGYVGQGHAETPLILEALIRGYFRQYQLRAARLCLDRWLEMQPENAQAYYLDGQFYLVYAHDEGQAAGRYRRALELDPDHEEAHLCLARALLGSPEDAKAAEAAEHLEYVRQRQPDNLSVLVGLAECRVILN